MVPAAALARYLDPGPARTIAAVVGAVAIIAGVGFLLVEARKGEQSQDEFTPTAADQLMREPRKVLLGVILTVVVVALIAVVLLAARA